MFPLCLVTLTLMQWKGKQRAQQLRTGSLLANISVYMCANADSAMAVQRSVKCHNKDMGDVPLQQGHTSNYDLRGIACSVSKSQDSTQAQTGLLIRWQIIIYSTSSHSEQNTANFV